MRKCAIILSILILSGTSTSCFRWAARAHKNLPEVTALDKTYSFEGRVIIVGAGASGLAAAKVLEQNKIDYLILEATDRFGGRLKKDTTLADFPIDMGAEWIHSNPKVLNVIKGKSNSQIVEDLIPYQLTVASNWDGKQLSPASNSYLKLYYNFMPESKFTHSTWYDFVEENLAKEVAHKISYSSVVRSINCADDHVVIETENGKTHKADRVLVTVSMGVLKSNKIRFSPEMSDEKKRAIESISFPTGFKVAMKFSDKFYPDAINCKVKSGEKVFYDIAFKKNARSNVLGFLCTGAEAQKYDSLNSEEKVISSLLQELDRMYDGKASLLFTGEYHIENWGHHEFTQGTWTQAFQEKKSHLKLLNQPLENKVYFAGEINDPYKQMGVPGAILSGYYSIDQLLTD